MFCKNCGKKLKDGVNFCKNCGSSVASINNAAHKAETKKNIINKNVLNGLIIITVITFLIAIIVVSANESGNSTSVNLNSEKDNSSINILDNTRSVVNIVCDNDSGGSGTIFTKEGRILTNNHVISGAGYCLVTLPNPKTGNASRIYHAQPLFSPDLSEKYDLAVLDIDGPYNNSDGGFWGDYPAILPVFKNSLACYEYKPLSLGDSIRIYGYPVTSGGYNLTVTEGVISSFTDDGYILTSAKVDSGNSGGLAIDDRGCFVGVPSAVLSGDYQNLGEIIPSDTAKRFLTEASTGTLVKMPHVNNNNQVCQDSFGLNSEWTGEIDNTDNTLICDCKTGYEWNTNQTYCIVPLTFDEICQRDVGYGSYYLGYKNSDGTLACSSTH